MTVYIYTTLSPRIQRVLNRDFQLIRTSPSTYMLEESSVVWLRGLIMDNDATSISFLIYTRDYELMPLVMGRSNREEITNSEMSFRCDGGYVHICSNNQGIDSIHGIHSITWEPHISIISRMLSRPRVLQL